MSKKSLVRFPTFSCCLLPVGILKYHIKWRYRIWQGRFLTRNSDRGSKGFSELVRSATGLGCDGTSRCVCSREEKKELRRCYKEYRSGSQWSLMGIYWQEKNSWRPSVGNWWQRAGARSRWCEINLGLLLKDPELHLLRDGNKSQWAGRRGRACLSRRASGFLLWHWAQAIPACHWEGFDSIFTIETHNIFMTIYLN